MNKLKTDFENKKTCVIVVNKSIAKTVLSSKKELVESVITRSLNWEDRENVLIKINRMCYWELKDFCISRQVPIMKTNPRWVKQQEIIKNSGVDRSFFSGHCISPAVINL
jgi:hypothetical protein